MAQQVELRLLGPPSIRVDGVRVHLARRRALALFAYLACDRRARARDALAALFWPDAAPVAARTSLRRALADLNAVLGRSWAREDDDAVEIDPALPLAIDVEMLQSRGRADTSEIALLDAWMPMARAPFMEGLALPGLEAFDEWRYAQTQATKRWQRELAQRATASAWRQGDVERALQWTSTWCALDDLDEKAFRAHLEALARAGRGDRIASEYQAFRARLQRELEVEPDAATRALFAKLRDTPTVETAAARLPEVRDRLRYVDIGDVRLATRVIGDAGPWIVMVPGFATHLDFALEHADSAAFAHRLARGRRLLLFDKRGMGLSDRHPPATPGQNARDAFALMDAWGIDEATVFGSCEGGPAALAMATLAPRRVNALILDGTSACWHACEDYPFCASAQVYAQWIEEMELRWGSAVGVSQFAPSRAADASVVAWWARMLRASASPSAIKSIFASAVDIDVRPLVPGITQPALVAHRDHDRVVRAANGRWLAEHLCNARWFGQAGSDHWTWSDTTLAASLADEIDRFLAASRICHAAT
jgi:pimeloyl-ACP methyl ester carboxylesterase/DNA-binding SARP family transcriptional activator